jgi:hypothetical protein
VVLILFILLFCCVIVLLIVLIFWFNVRILVLIVWTYWFNDNTSRSVFDTRVFRVEITFSMFCMEVFSIYVLEMSSKTVFCNVVVVCDIDESCDENWTILSFTVFVNDCILEFIELTCEEIVVKLLLSVLS